VSEGHAPAPPSDRASSAATVKHSRTARDMILSLVVLLIPLVLIVAIFRLRGGEDVVVVDPAPTIAQAQAANLFPILAPQGLGPEWRSVSAAFQIVNGHGTLRVGYITPSGGAAQLVESNEDAASLLPRELGDQVRPQGEVIVNGRAWRSSNVRGDEQALVDTTNERTVIAVGQASVDELTALAASLH
jgi:Protein of unknown function (DUF4245)